MFFFISGENLKIQAKKALFLTKFELLSVLIPVDFFKPVLIPVDSFKNRIKSGRFFQTRIKSVWSGMQLIIFRI